MTDMSLCRSVVESGRTYRFYDRAVLSFGYGLEYKIFHGHSIQGNFLAIPESSALRYSTVAMRFILTCVVSQQVNVKNAQKLASDSTLSSLVQIRRPKPHSSINLITYTKLLDVPSCDSPSTQLSSTLDPSQS